MEGRGAEAMRQRTEANWVTQEILEWVILCAAIAGAWAVPLTEGALPAWLDWFFAMFGIAALARILYRVIRG